MMAALLNLSLLKIAAVEYIMSGSTSVTAKQHDISFFLINATSLQFYCTELANMASGTW